MNATPAASGPTRSSASASALARRRSLAFDTLQHPGAADLRQGRPDSSSLACRGHGSSLPARLIAWTSLRSRRGRAATRMQTGTGGRWRWISVGLIADAAAEALGLRHRLDAAVLLRGLRASAAGAICATSSSASLLAIVAYVGFTHGLGSAAAAGISRRGCWRWSTLHALLDGFATALTPDQSHAGACRRHARHR